MHNLEPKIGKWNRNETNEHPKPSTCTTRFIKGKLCVTCKLESYQDYFIHLGLGFLGIFIVTLGFVLLFKHTVAVKAIQFFRFINTQSLSIFLWWILELYYLVDSRDSSWIWDFHLEANVFNLLFHLESNVFVFL